MAATKKLQVVSPDIIAGYHGNQFKSYNIIKSKLCIKFGLYIVNQSKDIRKTYIASN